MANGAVAYPCPGCQPDSVLVRLLAALDTWVIDEGL
jgi:hypothetical protein